MLKSQEWYSERGREEKNHIEKEAQKEKEKKYYKNCLKAFNTVFNEIK